MPMQPSPIAETSNSFPNFRFGSICPFTALSRVPFRHRLHTTIKLSDDLNSRHGCRSVRLLVGVVPPLVFPAESWLDHDAVTARKHIDALVGEPVVNSFLGN